MDKGESDASLGFIYRRVVEERLLYSDVHVTGHIRDRNQSGEGGNVDGRTDAQELRTATKAPHVLRSSTREKTRPGSGNRVRYVKEVRLWCRGEAGRLGSIA